MNSRVLLVSIFGVLCLGRAAAMPMNPGLTEMPVASIPVAPAKVTIDGKLDEWRSISGYDYNPFAQLMNAGDDPALAVLMADPISVSYKMCYDSDALYLGIAWRDRKAGTNSTALGDGDHWSEGGEGFQINIRTDRVLHLACWPTADGKVTVVARYDDDAAWQDIS
jgi:hypothetical protein